MKVWTEPDQVEPRITGGLQACCHGFVAHRVELDSRDFEELLWLHNNDPRNLRAVLVQMIHRFPEKRLGDKP